MTIHFIPSPHTHMYTHTHTGIECIKKYIEMLAWLFFVLFCFLAATLKCYSCASVDRPEDCQTTIECPSKDHVGENSRLYSICWVFPHKTILNSLLTILLWKTTCWEDIMTETEVSSNRLLWCLLFNVLKNLHLTKCNII